MPKGRLIRGAKGTRTVKGAVEGMREQVLKSKAEGANDDEAAFWGTLGAVGEAAAQSEHRTRSRRRGSTAVQETLDTARTIVNVFRKL